MIRQVIWDWNGTLLDDAAACVSSLNAMLRRRGMPEVTTEDYREIFGFPVQDYYRAIGFEFPPENWNSVATEYHDLYRDYAQDAPLRNDSIAALEKLRQRRIPMAVLSACELSILERMMEQRGVRRYFERIYGLSDLYAHSKLELGHELIADWGVRPEETLMIGDTIHDYEVALELHCTCVLIEGGHQSARRIRASGCPVLSGMSDVPGYLAHAAHE
jgi:phosphoglycolate phosphatase